MTPRKILRHWGTDPRILKRGGIIRRGSFSPAERELLQYAADQFAILVRELQARFHWRLHRVDLLFLTSRKVNAVLMRRGDRHAVGVHVGLVFQLFRATRQALSDPTVLRNYLSRDGLSARRARGLVKRPRVGGRFKQNYPLNPEREAWVWPVFGMMLEHVFLHELAHALRGHLFYANGQAAMNLLDEVHMIRRYADESVRDVEVDADVHAIDMWTDIALDAVDLPKRRGLREDLLFQKLFATNLLYQLLDATGLPETEDDGHPPPIHRMMMLTNAIAMTLQKKLHIGRRRSWAMWQQAGREARVVARSLGLPAQRWSAKTWDRNAYQRMLDEYLGSTEKKLDELGEALPDSLV